MSCNYADGLSPYSNKGKLGLPEIFDEPSEVDSKVEKLAEWIKASKYTVVHTGAGISTSSGIPDFRGPSGVWTLEEKGLKPNMNISFDQARPTFTHMALTALAESDYIKYIISQNIDGLHLRSGLKRSFISELHGNFFVSRCSTCEKEFIRSSSAPSVGQKCLDIPCKWVKSGGRPCRGRLHDNILDWEHNLPERDLEMAIMHSTLADLSICLGTTLQIVPAGNLPLKAKKNPNGKLVIINLQPTKNNNKADIVIHSKVDEVMKKLSDLLGLHVNPYSEELDPSQKLQKWETLGMHSRSLEWTIPPSSMSKLKKVLEASKGVTKQKTKTRKRSRRKIDDSESEDDDDFISEKYNPPPNPRCFKKSRDLAIANKTEEEGEEEATTNSNEDTIIKSEEKFNSNNVDGGEESPLDLTMHSNKNHHESNEVMNTNSISIQDLKDKELKFVQKVKLEESSSPSNSTPPIDLSQTPAAAAPDISQNSNSESIL